MVVRGTIPPAACRNALAVFRSPQTDLPRVDSFPDSTARKRETMPRSLHVQRPHAPLLSVLDNRCPSYQPPKTGRAK